MKYILFISAIAATTLFFGCKSSGSDPKAVIGQFFEAISKKDINTARKLTTADSKSMLDMMEIGMKSAGSSDSEKYDASKMEFGNAVINGDKATVAVKDKASGETMNYTLKKESGVWKVAFDKSSIMLMGMDKMKEENMNIGDSLTNALDQINSLDIDSLKAGLQEGADALEDAKKELDKLNMK
ncbi:MAG: hypothetical protein WD135_03620 [Ferruginibacter sp.]